MTLLCFGVTGLVPLDKILVLAFESMFFVLDIKLTTTRYSMYSASVRIFVLWLL